MQARSYWRSRVLFERALALVYLVAFLVAANQFVPLLGERGLLPVSRFIDNVPFSASPSLFFFASTDTAFRFAAWAGVALACLALSGLPQRRGAIPAAIVWSVLWLLYLSFVNVGQIFYGFGWETLLLETGFLAIFLGGWSTEPSLLLVFMLRWVLFRLMFGAGLIKLRGDSCWRDLTCLDYYFETQPMPNALSWYFHWLPPAVHHAGVLINHLVEVVAPAVVFAPQPFAAAAGALTIAFQFVLIASGNLSWLNWLTVVLAISTFDDRWLKWLPITPPPCAIESTAHRLSVYVLGAVVVLLSIAPTLNVLSSSQAMNTSFEPLHLVNSYGAFGTVTRIRDEIVVEGTDADAITDRTPWKEYEFRGKPGDPSRMPPQIAPYHLRLDWLMWFAAMEPALDHVSWFGPFVEKLLEGDRAALGLLRSNPFPDRPPRFIRAELFRYTFTSKEDHRRTGLWWNRVPVGFYMRPVSLDDFPRVLR